MTDYFTILGLAPGCYDPAEISRRFQHARQAALTELERGGDAARTHRLLEQLHLAHAALRDPVTQEECLRASSKSDDLVDLRRLRTQIAASLEDGLLRFSRRQEILDEGALLGLSEFQTHLLIAQVQFGDDRISFSPGRSPRAARPDAGRLAARVAAAGMLALAMFWVMVRWLGQ